MNNELQTLVEISRRYGSDPDFVIAGGGNTSFKNQTHMWVKASGQYLATIGLDGFVKLDLAALRDIVTQDFGDDPDQREALFKNAIYAARSEPELGQRPSVECVVHAILPQAYVIHTHATYANMVSCNVNGEALANELWGDDVVWIPYVDPGFTLAKEIHERTRHLDPNKPLALVWQNHGFTVAANDPADIERMSNELMGRVKQRVAPLPQLASPGDLRERLLRAIPRLRGAIKARGWGHFVTFCDDPVELAFASTPHSEVLTEAGPLIPDQIVYCKSFPLWLHIDEEPGPALDRHLERTGFPPKIVIFRGYGVAAVGPSLKEAQDASLMYRDAMRIMQGADQLGGVGPMSKRDREFIDAWEVEQYRRAVAENRSKGRMEGKAVVVTGGAQGIGLGIARGLGEDGAHIAVWDRNALGAQSVAEDLSRDLGRLRAKGLGVDVGSAEAVREAVYQTVRAFGGVDLFVSNAGILKAGSVMDQDPTEFELVTRVNYTGFFNCVQGIANAMAVQNQEDLQSWTDVVQINSKSGLQGSNRNGAYSGSKFGGIGLVQSFALELLEKRIKVNAVCPGNYFEGPLWSDPENGLFVQYLREGKVPGAQTVQDVKAFYEAKVPMGRGVQVEDILCAIRYAVEQRYETGQAIPVTGGQVMLS